MVTYLLLALRYYDSTLGKRIVNSLRWLPRPPRLNPVKLLRRQRDQDALCVNALADLLGVSQSAVSQYLRVLKSIGLVKGERRGYHMHYFID